MALQELSPPPRNTGLEQLGAVIGNAGERYAQNARQDQLLDRARTNQLADVSRERANQLSDVQSARSYSDTRFNVERTRALSDAQKLQAQQIRDAMIADAEKAGLLMVADADDPVKVQTAIQGMARLGLLEKYKPLLNSGALKAADVAKPLAVDTAINTTGERAIAQRANAQAAADDAQSQLAGVRSQMAQVMAKITTPPSQADQNDPEVIQQARMKAETIEPGSGRNKEKVAAQIGAAIEAVNLERMMNFRQQSEAAKIELGALHYSEQQLTDIIQQAAQTSQVFPSAHPAATGPQILQAPAPAKRSAATPDQIAAAIRAGVGGADPTAASGATPIPANVPDSTRAFIQSQNQLVSPVITAQKQLDDAQMAVQRAERGLSIQRPGGIAVGTALLSPYSPTTAPQISTAYQQLQDAQDNLAKVKAATGAPPAQPVGRPTTSAPAVFPVPGAAQQPAASPFSPPSGGSWWQAQ